MAERPHIVWIIADEFRAEVLGHRGNPAAVTPHLARGGVCWPGSWSSPGYPFLTVSSAVEVLSCSRAGVTGREDAKSRSAFDGAYSHVR